ncbi:MAG TPA: trigger factor [Candidatus Dormibacteraeota bacterium]|nr:trigger factor [Candidatus Dormibacteraeota bacterium]
MTTSTTPSDISVAVERQPASRVQLRVEAPATELDAAVNAALRRLAGRVRLPGFRPGKAPAAMVERAVGWDTVRQEAVDALLPDLYGRALDQAGVQPVDDPELDLSPVERGQPFVFTATVTVRPDVELGDYSSLRVDVPATEVTDEQVDEMIEELRRRNSELRDVERPAQAGDVLRCSLVMRRGEELLSGDEENDRDLDIDRERLLPGLADALIGTHAGQQRSFQLTLPEDFAREELRSATVDVDVKVTAVRERILPPLDDSLAAFDEEHGASLEELRADYRRRLEEVTAERDRETLEAAALERLRDHVVVELPESMVERELDRQVADLEARLQQMGMPLDRYLEYSGTTVEKVRGERREAAVQRLRLELALDALVQAEGIEVDEAAVVSEEQRVARGRKLTAAQRRRLHQGAHVDLARRAAGERLIEIVRGDG